MFYIILKMLLHHLPQYVLWHCTLWYYDKALLNIEIIFRWNGVVPYFKKAANMPKYLCNVLEFKDHFLSITSAIQMYKMSFLVWYVVYYICIRTSLSAKHIILHKHEEIWRRNGYRSLVLSTRLIIASPIPLQTW